MFVQRADRLHDYRSIVLFDEFIEVGCNWTMIFRKFMARHGFTNSIVEG